MTDPTNASAADARRTFAGPNLLQIAMPMGGIGSGCICLNGEGGLQDFAIHLKPATTALPDGWGTSHSTFALLHVKAGSGREAATRLIEGPLPIEKIYDQSVQAQGYRHGGHEGLPRFSDCRFEAEYPFGHVHLTDPRLPLTATVTGWSPFIPLDDINSSLPAIFLDYALENKSPEPVSYEFSFHCSNLAIGASGWKGVRAGIFAATNFEPSGVAFANTDDPNAETFGTAAFTVIGHSPKIKAAWFRGGWFDALSVLWNEVSTSCFAAREAGAQGEVDGRNGASIMLAGTLAPGEAITYPIVLSWHFPNSNQTYGGVDIVPPAKESGDPPLWRPFYASQWADAADVASYAAKNYNALKARTRAFADALYGSTLPAVALDAISSNLAILKSPTVMRQENGNIWAWEGCFTDRGSCHGTCTHVWNYAQALPHLFPNLERTIREQELLRSLDERGHMNFRAALPDGPTDHRFHAAADGQLGCILKLYRDWKISGDTGWLGRLYMLSKLSLDYCISLWDPDERGALFEPHHNTYDIEFWGADPMCTSIYVAALSAQAAMARALGGEFAADASRYETIAAKGANFLSDSLFNGAYYVQKVQWEGLRDDAIVKAIASESDPNAEMRALLAAEGPKYQYGSGCLSDGVIGAWMAAIYGVETPLDRDQIRSHLRAIFDHNFRRDLSKHACTQRPGYAMGREPGLLLCTWPNGGKPVLPFVYSDEVWTGIEYQVASHMIEEDMVDEGLAIVAAARSRYDGHVRNPFNEYECGSYYARAMASFALLPALSGFRFDATQNLLTLAPKISERPFRTFFSTASGFGTLLLTEEALTVDVIEGSLTIKSIVTSGKNRAIRALPWDVIVPAGIPQTKSLQ